jgi:hypothetical protein
MPSFKEAVAVITTFVVLAMASGRGDLVWKTIAQVRYHALQGAKSDWGNPSVFNKVKLRKYPKTKGKSKPRREGV